MLDALHQTTDNRMQKALDSLRNELIKIRTGRAHPSLIEHIRVSCYNSDMPLNQVASVSVGDSRTLVVTPWDKSVVSAVEKAIMQADLGLNPASAGQVIRVPLPPMTEERRKELIKLIRNEGENTKVAVRNFRRDANTQIKDALKEKTISEDDAHRSEEKIQKLTDKYINDIDKTLTEKETDLMEI